MTTKNYEKIKNEIKYELMQEFLFPILKNMKDSEGEYNPKFVKEVLKAAKEKPEYVYNPKTFLRQIGHK